MKSLGIVLMVVLAVVAFGAVFEPVAIAELGKVEAESLSGGRQFNWCGDWLSGDCNSVSPNSDYPPCTTQGATCDDCSRNYTLSACFLEPGFTCFFDTFDCGRLERGTCSSGPPYTCQNKTDIRDCWDIQITLINCPGR